MRCRKVRSFLSAYCKEETSVEVSAKIKRHLDGCNGCRREEQVYRSMTQLVAGIPALKASDEFTSRLFQRIGQEGFAEKRTKAYFPRRVPLFGTARLVAAASAAVVMLALGIGLNLGDNFLTPGSPTMVASAPVIHNTDVDDDSYLTVQPVDNPLLDEHKSVSRMIAQYNRWREYSRSLRQNSGAEHFLGNAPGLTLASMRTEATPQTNIQVRPVIKNYLIAP